MNAEKWDKLLKDNQPDFTPVISDHRTKMMLKYLESLIDFEPTTILEIGIGDGWFMNELRKKFPNAKITGLTIAELERNKAMQLFNFSEEEVILGDMHNMPFPDNSFDLIIHRDVFEHSIAPYLFLKEKSRVLAMNGQVIFAIPSYEWRNFDAHYSVFEPEQLSILIHKVGLALKNIQYKVWMFWGMTFGMRAWVYHLKKQENDDWYQESEAMYNEALKNAP